MLQGGFSSVLKAGSRAELLTEIVGFTHRLGFETVSATTIIDHFRGASEFIAIDNTPSAYRESFEDVSNWVVDPVAQHCKRHSVPIIWNQDTYTSVGQASAWGSRRASAIAPRSDRPWTLPDGASVAARSTPLRGSPSARPGRSPWG